MMYKVKRLVTILIASTMLTAMNYDWRILSESNLSDAKARAIEYFTMLFSGIMIDENEWWSTRMRNDPVLRAFGGVTSWGKNSFRDSKEHTGLQKIIIEGVEKKPGYILVKGFALFNDGEKRMFNHPMEYEDGKWKLSNIGAESKSFAP